MTTNFVRGSYQEIIDLHTQTNKISVIGIHTPTGLAPHKMFGPFYDAYRQFHYDGCSLSLVPTARLPADLAQVGYGAGEAPIDARDILNPILWHGCHGEDLNIILNQFLNGPNGIEDMSGYDGQIVREISQSIEMASAIQGQGEFSHPAQELEDLYYRALTDNTWGKAHPQRGFRKSGLHPLVYDVSSNIAMPAFYSPVASSDDAAIPTTSAHGGSAVQGGYDTVGSGAILGRNLSSGNLVQGRAMGDFASKLGSNNVTWAQDLTSKGMSLFSQRKRGLGWLETRTRYLTRSVPSASDSASAADIEEAWDQKLISSIAYHKWNNLPLLYMGIILLPPAYKTNQYFRLILNHRFSFRGFRGASLQDVGPHDLVPQYYDFNNEPSSKGGDYESDGFDGSAEKSND